MSAGTKLKYTLKVSSSKKTKGRKNQKSEEKEEKTSDRKAKFIFLSKIDDNFIESNLSAL